MPARAISAASCSGRSAAGGRRRRPRPRLLRERDQPRVERIGSIAHTCSHSTSPRSSTAMRAAAPVRPRASRRARRRRAGAGRRRARRRRSNAVAIRADADRADVVRPRVVARAALAEGEHDARRGDERVPPGVHRRRAGVRGPAPVNGRVALDPDGADAPRRPTGRPLEHRALLDVQLEVGERRRAAARALAGAVEVDAVRGQRVGQATPSRSVTSRTPRGSSVPAQGPSRAAAAEARPLLVGPVDERDRDGGGGRSRRARAAPRGRRARRARRRASRRRARSRGGCRDTTASGVAPRASPRCCRPRPCRRCTGRSARRSRATRAPRPRVGPRDALGAAVVLGQGAQRAQIRERAVGIGLGGHRVRNITVRAGVPPRRANPSSRPASAATRATAQPIKGHHDAEDHRQDH